MTKRTFINISATIIMFYMSSGCMMFQRLNMEDIKNEKYFYKSYIINKSIPLINKTLYDYSLRCRPLPKMTVDPVTKKTGYIAWQRFFTANPKIIGLIEFAENDDGTTIANAYWYYTTIDGILSDNIIGIINNNKMCRDLY